MGIRQLGTIVSGSLSTVLRSARFLGGHDFLRFWLSKRPEEVITLGGIRLGIRSYSLRQKMVDLFVATYCILDREYNPPGFELKADDTVIDIGGHIGSFALLAAKSAPNGKVYTFEPDAQNFSRIKRNIDLNSLSNIHPINSAVVSTNAPTAYYRNETNDSSSSLTRPVGAQSTVSGISLVQFFTDHSIEKVDFMKIDCEGSEYDIIFNTPDSLFKKIRTMAIEVHDPRYFHLPRDRYNKHVFLRRLHELGYTTKVVYETHLHDLIFARRP
ncbi:MAG: FkbM family methyltransferase [Patescibacteria group bacterium]